MEEQHSKIIKQVAKAKFSPEGLFRVGQSRCWVDDNGYFAILVEYQPHGYKKGTFLNIGIHFLWEGSSTDGIHTFNYSDNRETIRVDLSNGLSNSKYDFVEYDGDDVKFTAEVERFADLAIEKIYSYRRFRDLDYAKEALLTRANEVEKPRLFWEAYHAAMFCFLTGDLETGRIYFDDFIEIAKGQIWRDHLYIEWIDKLYHHCIEDLLPQCDTRENASKMVLNMIKDRRLAISKKSSYKKMNAEHALLEQFY